jgi:hypothetical protein
MFSVRVRRGHVRCAGPMAGAQGDKGKRYLGVKSQMSRRPNFGRRASCRPLMRFGRAPWRALRGRPRLV